MKYFSRPKSAAVKDIDIADILANTHRYRQRRPISTTPKYKNNEYSLTNYITNMTLNQQGFSHYWFTPQQARRWDKNSDVTTLVCG